ncbi:hypothetical protein M0813_21923 [Anaeramoeba flamelloides]|uniref:Uncharacterized protein n=1 Tax=Anaeramoeba flamelloides TaxID=1746091 RepID=A0ABQ8YFV7_9EUKA|nr:hypothetical protein M0813_21923 [Anaeramoeba flamelloides]
MNKPLARTTSFSVDEKHFHIQKNLSELKKFVKSIDSQLKILPESSTQKLYVKSSHSTLSLGKLSVNEQRNFLTLERDTALNQNLNYYHDRSYLQTKKTRNTTFLNKRRNKCLTRNKRVFKTEDTLLEDL